LAVHERVSKEEHPPRATGWLEFVAIPEAKVVSMNVIGELQTLVELLARADRDDIWWSRCQGEEAK
jgi:hypothetical protein